MAWQHIINTVARSTELNKNEAHKLSYKFYISSAFLSPIAALFLAALYIIVKNSGFWASSPDSAAGALMSFAEVILLLVSLVVGCCMGVLFSVKSILICKSKLSITVLIVNVLPLLVVAIFSIKGFVYGI